MLERLGPRLLWKCESNQGLCMSASQRTSWLLDAQMHQQVDPCALLQPHAWQSATDRITSRSLEVFNNAKRCWISQCLCQMVLVLSWVCMLSFVLTHTLPSFLFNYSFIYYLLCRVLLLARWYVYIQHRWILQHVQDTLVAAQGLGFPMACGI